VFLNKYVSFWATVCKTVSLSHGTVVCLSYPVLSVTLVYCGQTVGWIRMQLGTEVGLGRGHIVLDGDPALPTERATAAPTFEIYVRRLVNRGRCLLWPNGWMDQAATWYRGRPRPRPHCVRWGPSPPKGYSSPRHFSAHVYCGKTVAHLSYC